MLEKIVKVVKDYKAKDIMTTNVITLPPSETLLKAQSLMSQRRIKRIVVVEDDTPIGIITIKDILRSVVYDQTDRDMHEMLISEAMSKRLVTAGKTSSIAECTQFMTRESVSSIVVIEQAASHPKLSGIITHSDFTDFFAEKCTAVATVRECMSHPVITISINERMPRAMELMLKNNISHLVVMGSDNLLGIFSERDLLLITLAFKSKTLRSVYENNLILFHSSKKRNLVEPALVSIKDVFTPNPTIIEENADFANAAKIMMKEGISAILVVNSPEGSKEHPVGIVTKTDIVKTLAHIDRKVGP
jgi:CBS domain-containing protein